MEQTLETLNDSAEPSSVQTHEVDWLYRGLDFNDPRDREIHVGFACSCSTYCDAIVDEDEDL